MSTPALPAHLVALGDSTWGLWRDVVLRSAGFPADLVLNLRDDKLTAAADAAITSDHQNAGYQQEYEQATERLSHAVQQIAALPLFREAVTWQNPKVVPLCLDKLRAGEPRNSQGRQHQLALANYLQRYCLKNDTIGFFGSVGWARWTDDDTWLTTDIGAKTLERRTVQLESWAVDILGETIFSAPEVQGWLTPRRFAMHKLQGSTLYRADRTTIALDSREKCLLQSADGESTLHDIANALVWSEHSDLGDPQTLHAAYTELAERQLVILGYPGTIRTNPEVTLVEEIEKITDPTIRNTACALVTDILAARDRVAAAAGDQPALAEAMTDLNARFESATGQSSGRRAGQLYAGRTLVYEDTVLGTRVELGTRLRQELTAPMLILLAAARWLIAEVAQEYDHIFQGLYDRRAEQTGSAEVPFGSFLSLVTPHLFSELRSLNPPVVRVVGDFRRRWASIMGLPSPARTIQLNSEDIREDVARLFPGRGSPWATSIYSSPDIMIAAQDPEAISQGDFQFVLGELHLSFNSIEARVLVDGHDDPASLLSHAESDLQNRRIYGIPAKESAAVGSRVAPPSALLSPNYTYWTQHQECVNPPGPIIPTADLVVRRENGQLVVCSPNGTYHQPLAETLGESLADCVVNAFTPVEGAHTPRVSIDRLIVSREAWTFEAKQMTWASIKSEAELFLECRRWKKSQGLPEQFFAKVPVENKPSYVDLSSLIYVNAFAKLVRRTARAGGVVKMTEMVPDMSQMWLHDAAGNRYASELRTIAVCSEN